MSRAAMDEGDAADAARIVEQELQEDALAALLPALDCPFGPAFFLGPLRAFVRERCPVPDEGLPRVTLHLTDGDRLEVCHVIGLAADYVALAVYDPALPFGTHGMVTVLVPYGSIARAAVRACAPHESSLGFDAARRTVILTEAMRSDRTAEELLRAAAEATPPPVAIRGPCDSPCCPTGAAETGAPRGTRPPVGDL